MIAVVLILAVLLILAILVIACEEAARRGWREEALFAREHERREVTR